MFSQACVKNSVHRAGHACPPARPPPRRMLRDAVNEQAVRTLLEYIFVYYLFSKGIMLSLEVIFLDLYNCTLIIFVQIYRSTLFENWCVIDTQRIHVEKLHTEFLQRIQTQNFSKQFKNRIQTQNSCTEFLHRIQVENSHIEFKCRIPA